MAILDENGEIDQEEVMLPGFRFHPTDEELVGFYLRKKVEQKPLAIQLIRQLNIYKYEPWDLPKLAITGEKEWYFCCQRDRKYRNSSRPNRVTGGGFWKATGIDRPIHSSDGTKRIGLKKSLVFYEGRAGKGIKTDWMMHELRLPSLSDSSPASRPFNKNIPNSDSWAIYRIFKKTKTNNSLAQKALPQSSPSSLPEITDVSQLSFESSTSMNQVGSTNGLHSQQQHTNTSHPPDATSCKPSSNNSCKHSLASISSSQIPASFMFSPVEMSVPTKSLSDVASRLHNISPTIFTDGVREVLPMAVIQNLGNGEKEIGMKEVMKNTCSAGNDHLETMQANNFPLDMSPRLYDEWKITNLQWDSSSYPIEMTSYHTNEC